MILLGCLLAFSVAVAPRVVLVLAWIFSTRWELVWRGEFLWPLLGIVFLPYTTIMFMLAVTITPSGNVIEGWDWLWIILGLILDLTKWGQLLTNRQEAQHQVQRYYPSGAPRGGAAASAVAAPAATTGASHPTGSGPSTSSTSPAAAVSPDLARLAELHASGTLSDEEYEAAKAKLKG